MKCNFPDPRHKIPPLGNLAKEVIQVMLRALATSTPTSSNQSAEENAIMVFKVLFSYFSLLMFRGVRLMFCWQSKEEEKKKKLIPKSSIMRLLAELVRSYVGCANYIANQSYRANETDLISEVSLSAFLYSHSSCCTSTCTVSSTIILSTSGLFGTFIHFGPSDVQRSTGQF